MCVHLCNREDVKRGRCVLGKSYFHGTLFSVTRILRKEERRG